MPVALVRHLAVLPVAAAFIAVGGWMGWQNRSPHPPYPPDPQAALEMHAAYGTGSVGATQQLAQALEKLPPHEPLLVFFNPAEVHSAMAMQSIRYLAWPRAVEQREGQPGDHGETRASMAAQYAAFVLCGGHAPANYPGVYRIGPGLEIVNLHRETQP
jgi:hypothetical protein